MGSDNLFHKRKALKARQEADLKRKAAKKEPYAKILIVCEDSKATPQYLEDFRQELKLSTANIIIAREKHGCDPKSVVTFAIDKFKETRDFDQIYCVIDRDNHPNYAQALQISKDKQLKNNQDKSVNINLIVSIPCFEYWLLLHFQNTTKSFEKSGDKSPCDLVISGLKQYISNYDKGKTKIYGATKDKLNDAIIRAKQIDKSYVNDPESDKNPSTDMYKLVECLLCLKEQKEGNNVNKQKQCC